MAHGPLGNVVDRIRQWAGGAAPAGQATDSELLERFVRQQEQAAFAAIVQRHGRVVFNVCLRILQDRHAAEDAFQATFLVLARRAHAIRERGSLASWLYGVAYRVAVRARVQARRRTAQERQAEVTVHDDPSNTAVWSEMRPVLDAEVQRLPDKYRAPLVLCYFEGLSNDEAAAQLRWPSGTVKGRLARARDLLRGRLERRGIALSAVALTTALGSEAVAAAVPEVVARSTLAATSQIIAGQALGAGLVSTQAITLCEGVVHSMIATKVKIVAALVVLLGLTGGAGWFSYQALAQNAPAPQQNADKPTELKFTTISKAYMGGPQKAAQRVATSQKELDAIIKDYGPNQRAMFMQQNGGQQRPGATPYDFAKQMVIEVAMGQKGSGGHAIEITKIEQTKDGVVVHYKETSPGPNDAATAVITSPYHVVRADKGTGNVKFVKAEK